MIRLTGGHAKNGFTRSAITPLLDRKLQAEKAAKLAAQQARSLMESDALELPGIAADFPSPSCNFSVLGSFKRERKTDPKLRRNLAAGSEVEASSQTAGGRRSERKNRSTVVSDPTKSRNACDYAKPSAEQLGLSACTGGEPLLSEVPTNWLALPIPRSTALEHLQRCFEVILALKRLDAPKASLSRQRQRRRRAILPEHCVTTPPELLNPVISRFLEVTEVQPGLLEKTLIHGFSVADTEFARVLRWLQHLVDFGFDRLRSDPIVAAVIEPTPLDSDGHE